MPFTQADLDGLDAGYKSGADVLRCADGRTVEYRSVEEYFQLRRLMKTDIAQEAGVALSSMVHVASTRGI